MNLPGSAGTRRPDSGIERRGPAIANGPARRLGPGRVPRGQALIGSVAGTEGIGLSEPVTTLASFPAGRWKATTMTDHSYEPVPEPLPVQTTALDWAEQARRDGWRLIDGVWQHDDRSDAYDDGDWVYLGGGAWEDAYIGSLTPDQRRDVLARYDQLQPQVSGVHRRPDEAR